MLSALLAILSLGLFCLLIQYLSFDNPLRDGVKVILLYLILGSIVSGYVDVTYPIKPEADKIPRSITIAALWPLFAFTATFTLGQILAQQDLSKSKNQTPEAPIAYNTPNPQKSQ